jgi:hypothetical protein
MVRKDRPVIDPNAPPPRPVLVGEQPGLPKPNSVTMGVRLFYASLVLGLVGGLLSLASASRIAASTPNLPSGVFTGSLIFGMILGLGIFLGLILAADKGKNWARITILVFFVLGLLISLPSMGRTFALMPVNGIISIVQLLLQGTALYFLFTPASTAWYNSSR